MSVAPDPYQFFNLASALEYLGDSQGVRDMVPLLSKALARDVPEISHLLEKGDAVEAAALLHSLKGFLPIFCFPALVEELVCIEKWCKAGPSADLLLAYKPLASQLMRLGQEVSHYEAQKA
jgi:HPt (histidine-containing phosphotransfer) domain-containing protein